MSELKRCPFCGQKMIPSHKLPKHPNGYLKWMRFHPENKCFLSAFVIDLRETEKVEEWNTRKPMQNIVERLEKEQETLETDMWARECDNWHGQYCNGISEGLEKAMEIVKEEGELHEI